MPRAAPKPTLFLLVRHGTTPTTGDVLPGRAPGLHLSEVGEQQAEIVGQRIAEIKKPAAVYSSPMERARETAQAIAKATGLKVRTTKGLLECDFGEWTGKKLSQLRKKPEWNHVQNAPSTFRFPGGESFAEMQQRMVTTLDRLQAEHPGKTVVCASHADPIKALAAHALGVHLDLFQRIVISPCSVTAVLWGGRSPIVLAVNSTGSLSALAPS